MTDRKVPPAPAGLGKRGRRYWRNVQGVYELSDSETQILTEVCRTLDDLDRLAESVAQDGAMVQGSAGQPVVNPALSEVRGQRAILHRLVAALALPDVEGAAVPTGHQLRAVAANRARWSGHVKESG